jgi:hypothetical protein
VTTLSSSTVSHSPIFTLFPVSSPAITPMDHDFVVYQFSRAKVERADFSHFIQLYDPAKLPSGRRLRVMMNTLTFLVEGFDDDPREVHAIPEIRSFYQAFHAAWPYWLYFCRLESEEFQTMVLCCLPSIASLQSSQHTRVTVEFDPTELRHFLSGDFGPLNALCKRGGMFDDRIYDRTKAVFESFGLPYDGGPRPAR